MRIWVFGAAVLTAPVLRAAVRSGCTNDGLIRPSVHPAACGLTGPAEACPVIWQGPGR